MARLMLSVYAVLLLALLPVAVCAQAPQPSVDAAARGISMSQAEGIRLMGMGGVLASVPDLGNARSPAAMVRLPKGPSPMSLLVFSYGATTMSPTVAAPQGTRFNTRATTIGAGDGEREIVLLRFTRVSSPISRSIIRNPVTGLPTPIDQDISYDLFMVGYGRRINDRLYGSAMLAASNTGATIYAPGTETPIGAVAVDPDPGFEAALYYRLSDQVALGGSWIRLRGVENTMLGTLPATSRILTSDIFRVGASYRPDDATTLAAEWGGLGVKDRTNGRSSSDRRFYFGAERWLTPEVALRAGSFGGQTSFGVGVRIKKLTLDYAYVDDLNQKSTQKLFPMVPPASSRTNYIAASSSF